MVCNIQKCNTNMLEKGIKIAKIDHTKGDNDISNITQSLYCALIDSGSQVTTTNHKWLIHESKPITFDKYIYDAGKKVEHKVIGEGYIRVPNSNGIYSNIHLWHTPSIPTTIISPAEIMQLHNSIYTSHTIHSNTKINQKGRVTQELRQNQ